MLGSAPFPNNQMVLSGSQLSQVLGLGGQNPTSVFTCFRLGPSVFSCVYCNLDPLGPLGASMGTLQNPSVFTVVHFWDPLF